MARATLILIDVPLSKIEAVRQRIALCVQQSEWIVATAQVVQQEQETQGLPSDLL